MTEPKKRAPARKAPTKAAALKALGLTASELETLKAAASQLAELKTEQAKIDAAVEERELERKALVQQGAKQAQAADLLRKDDQQAALENRQAPVPTPIPESIQTKESVWYMRNLRGVDVGFRLSRQNDSGKKRTNLKPRGQRGDIVKLEPGDLQDAELQVQVSYGLVEIIPEGEALNAIKKQYTNHAQTIPVHIAALRGPLGQEYAQANPVQMLSHEEANGYKVADLDPGLMQGKLDDRQIGRTGGFADNIIQPVQNPSPGRVVEFMAPAQQAVGGAANNEHAANVDALARSKQFEGPGAGLGEVTVTVAPVEKS